MKKILILAAFMFLTVSSSSAFEGARTNYYLDNGMEVVITEVPTSPVVALYGLVKTGSATEGKYLGSGISHYLEHMLFKGTDRRGHGEIAGEIQSLGGNINATTSKAYTNYTITVPHAHFDKGLDVLADMLQNATIDADDAASEKDVIKNEMRLHNDNPRRFLHNQVFLNSYREHPYRHPTIGYPRIFEQIAHKELYDYYKLHYAPNNMILSIAGNIKIDEIKPKIDAIFGDFTPQPYVSHDIAKEPVQMAERVFKHAYPTNITRALMAYHSVPLLHKDLYPLDVLANILGSGKTSRLYQALYEEERIVHSISAGNYTPKYPGLFEIEFSLDYANLDAAIEKIKSEIEHIKNDGVDKKELEKIKRKSIANHVFYSQTAPELAHSQVMDAAFANDYLFSDKYVEGMKAVTEKDVVRVAKKYLTDDNLTTTVLYPESEKAAVTEVKNKGLIGDLQTVKLDNGATLLLKENHMFEMVSIYVVFQGGLRYQEEDVVGIAEMTQRLMQQGTKKYDFEELTELEDQRGMIMGGFSGSNSMGFRFQFLPDDTELVMDLLEQVVLYPTFPEKRLEKIKTNMLVDINNRKDNVFRYTREVLNETLFKGHPYQWRPAGYEETVGQLTRDKVKTHYKKVVHPENMVIAVAGDFDTSSLKEALIDRFEDMPAGQYVAPELSTTPVTEKKVIEMRLPKEQAAVIYGFRGTTLDHEDRYKLEVLTGVLGSSFNGRMFTKIRDKLGKAYTLGGFDVPGIDTGSVYFYVMTTDQHVGKVQELLDKEIVDLQKNLVTDEELDDIKTYLKGSFDESIEKINKLNYMMSLNEVYGLGAEDYLHYKARIDAVTKDDIRTMARKYFDLQRAVVAVSRPETAAEEK